MGFNAGIRILYPDRKVVGGKTVWMPKEYISFGYVTRLGKLQDGRENCTAHARAGICIAGCMLDKLINNLQNPDKSHFVPRFLMYRDYAEDWEAYDDFDDLGNNEWREAVDNGPHFNNDKDTQQLMKSGGKLMYPDFTAMDGHNAALEWSQDRFQNYIRHHYNICSDSLFMWESCQRIAEWLYEAEEKNGMVWIELNKDPVSLAKFKAWRAYLAEIGTIEVRAMFLFPKYYGSEQNL